MTEHELVEEWEVINTEERSAARDPNIGTGSPETAPHEHVNVNLWERVRFGLKNINNKEDN